MTEPLLPIGEVADAVGVAVSTVRYYDRIGLVPATTRRSGQRRYDQSAIARLEVVRRARLVGFGLDEIAALLADDDQQWIAVVEAKLDQLITRRDHLDALIHTLTELRRCTCRSLLACPRVQPDTSHEHAPVGSAG